MSWYDKTLEELIGKHIVKIETDGKDYLIFTTNDGELCLHFDGDCCSSSYLTEIVGVKNVVDKGEIKTVLEFSLGDRKTKDGYECIERHGILITGAGDYWQYALLVLWENSSNGYYDGSINKTTIKDRSGFFELKENWVK